MLLQLPPRDEDILNVEFSREHNYDVSGIGPISYAVNGVMRFMDDRFEHPPQYGDEFVWRKMRWHIVEVSQDFSSRDPFMRIYTAQLTDEFKPDALNENPIPHTVPY